MILLFLFALQLPPALELPPAVEAWKAEIEAKLFDSIPLIRIPGDPIPPADLQVLRPTLTNPSFLANFDRTQALTLRYEAGERKRALVFLNMTMIPPEKDALPALIAHELGHIWLASIGFQPLPYVPGPNGCLAIHASDMVQHTLMRREMDRRGIDWRTYFLRDYENAYAALVIAHKKGDPPGDACWRAQRLALMVDVRDTVPAERSEARDGYLEILGEQDREAEAIAIEFLEEFDGKIELEPKAYAKALEAASAAVTRLTGLKATPN